MRKKSLYIASFFIVAIALSGLVYAAGNEHIDRKHSNGNMIFFEEEIQVNGASTGTITFNVSAEGLNGENVIYFANMVKDSSQGSYIDKHSLNTDTQEISVKVANPRISSETVKVRVILVEAMI